MTIRQWWISLLVCSALLAFSIKLHIDNGGLHQQVAAQKEFIEQREALIDSLHGELFNANCMLGRYELSLDHLGQVNRSAKTEFERYFEHETE
jgi:hypothetical protein